MELISTTYKAMQIEIIVSLATMVATNYTVRILAMVARTQQIRRPARRRPTWHYLGCGCLATLGILAMIAVIGVIVLLPRMPELAASVVGLSAEGETSTLFEDTSVEPTPQLQNATAPEQVTVNLGGYGGEQAIDTNNENVQVEVGSDASGQQTAVVSFTEAGLLEICRQRSPVCNGSDPRFQNTRLDLQPNGAVIYADVSVPTQFGFTVQQPAGFVLQLDSSRRQFQFAGIDLNGNLYTNPPAQFADQEQQFEQTGNDILNQVTLDAGTGNLALSEVIIDDATLTLVML